MSTRHATVSVRPNPTRTAKPQAKPQRESERRADSQRPATRGGPSLPTDERIGECLRDAIGDECFCRYFGRPAQMRYEGGVLTVTVRNRFLASLLDRRFSGALREAVTRATGLDEARVQFVVDNRDGDAPADAHEEPDAAPPGEATRTPPAAARRGRHRPDRGASGACRHRLEQFIVGESNRLAYNAALRLVEHDGPDAAHLSPLFIHGSCGMGKTHLLRGAASRFRSMRPGAAVRFRTGEAFTNEFLAALRGGRVEQFRRAYRKVDLLCIDDVHFVANKQATQAELLHTFDAVAMSGARVILASDEHPRNIQRISRALVSRFLSGLTAALAPPERDLRERLIRAFAVRRGLDLDDTAVTELSERAAAAHPDGAPSIRDLEGLVNRVEAVTRLLPSAAPSGRIGALAVEAALGTPGVGAPKRPARPIRIEQIIGAACRAVSVDPAQIGGRGRHRRVVLARSMTAFLARELTTLSFPEIARGMGRPTHSTIIAACRRFRRQLDEREDAAIDGETPGTTVNVLCQRARRILERETARV